MKRLFITVVLAFTVSADLLVAMGGRRRAVKRGREEAVVVVPDFLFSLEAIAAMNPRDLFTAFYAIEERGIELQSRGYILPDGSTTYSAHVARELSQLWEARNYVLYRINNTRDMFALVPVV